MKTGNTGLDDEWSAVVKSRQVEILLKNGRVVTGFVIGYFKQDADEDQSPVIAWHIVKEIDKMSMGIDAFGYLVGEIIAQKEIQQIKSIDKKQTNEKDILNFNPVKQ